MLNYAIQASESQIENGTDYWQNPSVEYLHKEFYKYTTMLPSMIKMYAMHGMNTTEFGQMVYNETNFYDYTIYEDQHEEPEFFAEYDDDEDLYSAIELASYFGEIL